MCQFIRRILGHEKRIFKNPELRFFRVLWYKKCHKKTRFWWIFDAEKHEILLISHTICRTAPPLHPLSLAIPPPLHLHSYQNHRHQNHRPGRPQRHDQEVNSRRQQRSKPKTQSQAEPQKRKSKIRHVSAVLGALRIQDDRFVVLPCKLRYNRILGISYKYDSICNELSAWSIGQAGKMALPRLRKKTGWRIDASIKVLSLHPRTPLKAQLKCHFVTDLLPIAIWKRCFFLKINELSICIYIWGFNTR